MTDDKPKENNNILYIGAKPFMNYVTNLIMQFTARKGGNL